MLKKTIDLCLKKNGFMFKKLNLLFRGFYSQM